MMTGYTCNQTDRIEDQRFEDIGMSAKDIIDETQEKLDLVTSLTNRVIGFLTDPEKLSADKQMQHPKPVCMLSALQYERSSATEILEMIERICQMLGV